MLMGSYHRLLGRPGGSGGSGGGASFRPNNFNPNNNAGGGQTEGTGSNVPNGYPGRGSGGNANGQSGASGVVIVKVR